MPMLDIALANNNPVAKPEQTAKAAQQSAFTHETPQNTRTLRTNAI